MRGGEREKIVLFNEAVNCWDYTAAVIDELISVGHRWNDIDRVNMKYTLLATNPAWIGLDSVLGIHV
jgi:hypothetical protein